MTSKRLIAHRRRMVLEAWLFYVKDPVAGRDWLHERVRKFVGLGIWMLITVGPLAAVWWWQKRKHR